MPISQRKLAFFQKALLKWYKTNDRNFDWRKAGTTEYEKIISEVLLQRTKAQTVSKFFPIFLEAYPTWLHLAATSIEDLEEMLRPIGLYKQRASRLKALAVEMKNREYKIPEIISELNEMPMFGQYISNATQLLVFNIPAPLLDVNMARVLERFFGERKMADIRYDPYLQQLAHQVVNIKRSKELNWAILDFAFIVCKVHNPLCFSCIINKACEYFKNHQND